MVHCLESRQTENSDEFKVSAFTKICSGSYIEELMDIYI